LRPANTYFGQKRQLVNVFGGFLLNGFEQFPARGNAILSSGLLPVVLPDLVLGYQ